MYFSESYIPYDDTGQRAYENACKKYKALTSTSFHRKLAESTNIDLRHYGAGPRGGKALAIPLVVSPIMAHFSDVTRSGISSWPTTHHLRNKLNADEDKYKLKRKRICVLHSPKTFLLFV